MAVKTGTYSELPDNEGFITFSGNNGTNVEIVKVSNCSEVSPGITTGSYESQVIKPIKKNE